MPAIRKGNQYMQVVTYTGNGTSQTIEVGFKVGLVWIKRRDSAGNNGLFDVVRGATNWISSNATTAETAGVQGVTAFTATGFTLGNHVDYNTNGATYVAWCWAAGDTTVTNTNGTISSQVSANPTSGFSIVTYTGNGTNGATVGHGLGIKPSLIIEKGRSTTYNWSVQGCGVLWTPATSTLFLNATNALNPSGAITAPTSSVFTPSATNYANENGVSNVAYCFTEIAGFSKFGSYTGNGSADGPFLNLGFRPRFLLLKSATNAAYGWTLWDSSRNTYNIMDKYLQANAGNAEEVFGVPDFLSNGFKIRTSNVSVNENGGTMIYAAFAENPFKNSLAR